MSLVQDKRSASCDDLKEMDNEKQAPEKFPLLGISVVPVVLGRKLSIKSKSLTDVEVIKKVIVVPDLATTIQTLKSQEPPEDLHQVRARSASVKETNREIRKRAVTLIRSRTASRASALGRPSISNDGRPNLADIQQGKQT